MKKEESIRLDKSVLKLKELMQSTPLIEMIPEKIYEIDIPNRENLKDGERLTPLSDRVFKFAFQNEEYKDFACKLISCLTGITVNYLLENMIFYKNNINETDLDEVQRVGDLLIKVGNTYYQVEMNNYQALGRNIKSALLASTIRTKDKRDVIFFPMVEIGLNNYRLKGITDAINVFGDLNILKGKNNEILTKRFHIEVFLPLIMEKEYNKLNETEKVLRALFTSSSNEGKRLAKGDEILMRYSEVMEQLVDSPIMMEGYDIKGSNRAHLEMKYRDEGREAEKTSVIKNMLDNGFKIDMIAKCVNLKVPEVKKIIASFNKTPQEVPNLEVKG